MTRASGPYTSINPCAGQGKGVFRVVWCYISTATGCIGYIDLKWNHMAYAVEGGLGPKP